MLEEPVGLKVLLSHFWNMRPAISHLGTLPRAALLVFSRPHPSPVKVTHSGSSSLAPCPSHLETPPEFQQGQHHTELSFASDLPATGVLRG